jgi:hypothetical protein
MTEMTDPQEIKTLIAKGAQRLNTFFYVGLVMGALMGPAVLIAASIPAVREAVAGREANPQLMVVFGVGMTVLLGVASAEQWVKVRKDRELLEAVSANPHRIVEVRKETTNETFTHVHFRMRDGTRAKVWLEEPDAQRLVALLTVTPMIFCPYCLTPIGEGTVICSQCAQNVTNDAPLEMTLNAYRVDGTKACPHCKAAIARLAVRCPECGVRI